MPRTLATLLTLTAVLACMPETGGEDADTAPPDAPDNQVVVLETSLGNITLDLFAGQSPETVKNFVAHVRSGFYDGLTFYRVIPGFMIQGGLLTPDLRERTTTAWPVANEADNGLKNLRGTLAMARTGDAHSATTDFFINLVDNPTLDFKDKTPQGWGYAVFGEVTDGMDVVDAIAQVPTTRKRRFQDIPVVAVVIERAYVREAES
jgi:cyclophilin family peptidyl-prolyl cis-trans isomerase